MVKIICIICLLFSLYDTLRKDKLGIAYVLIIFTKSCWTTSLYMYVQLNLVKMILSLLSSVMFVAELDFDIDEIVKHRVLDIIFWKRSTAMEVLL